MWRWLAGGVSLLLMGAALIAFSSADSGHALPPPPEGTLRPDAAADLPLPPLADRAEPDREAKRLARYDRDKDGAVSRDEYLRSRERAFAKLDVNGDGRLSFDEYAVKTIGKFDTADADDSGRLSADEFATTAVKRKPKAPCPPTTGEADG